MTFSSKPKNTIPVAKLTNGKVSDLIRVGEILILPASGTTPSATADTVASSVEIKIPTMR